MRKKIFICIGIVALGLGACSHSSNVDGSDESIKEALITADKNARKSSTKEEALGYYAKIYNKNSNNPDVAVAYARALRESGFATKSITVMSPIFAKDSNSKDIALEYIKDHLMAGLYPAAQNMATNFIENDTKLQRMAVENPTPSAVYYAPYEFYELLGISYDAQGVFVSAETNLRIALKLAVEKDEKAGVMNNLALNLLNQKKINEAMKMVSEAFTMAPDKPKIARNLELIGDLYKSQKKK